MWRRELRYPMNHLHGRIALGRARHFDQERLAKIAKSPSFSALTPSECLFLDTETTGLSGGAGTMVFAYGLAFFDEDELVLDPPNTWTAPTSSPSVEVEPAASVRVPVLPRSLASPVAIRTEPEAPDSTPPNR